MPPVSRPPSAPERQQILARLRAAAVVAPRAEAVVVDLANDPPFAASARAIAVEESLRVIDGLGAAMVASGARRGVVAVRSATAFAALESARRERAAAAVRITRVADVYPSVGIARDLAGPYAWQLDGEALLDLEAAALARPRAPRRVSVVGTVARPSVLAADGPRTVEQWVDGAGGVTGGALGEAWAALDGGVWGGRLAARDDLVRSPLLLVLPVAHPWIARARTSVAEWLRRAASACEGCRACTDVCPVALDGGALAPDALLRSLVAVDSTRQPSAALTSAAACVGCGVCDAACPSSLSPFSLVDSVRSRLPAPSSPPSSAPPSAPLSASFLSPPSAAPHPERASRRMSVDLLLARAGLPDIAPL